MKPLISLVCAVIACVLTCAQTPLLRITTDKTTSLIFPYPIKHVDRGSRDVLVQPVPEAANVLLVKAALKDFAPTNLSVITGDGSVYAMAVCYGENLTWIYRFPPQVKTAVATYAVSLLDNPKTTRGIKDKSGRMRARVTGIYSKDDVLYYQLELQNDGPFEYNIHFLRCYTRDKTRAKRTAIQEEERTPLYVAGNSTLVKAYAKNSIVVALDRFPVPRTQYLAIEIGEKNGVSPLVLKLSNRKTAKAIPLPDLK